MNRDEESIDGLAAQECESLAACIARGQEPASYQDIIGKLRGHCEQLPAERRTYWADWCKTLGVTLFPEPKKAKSIKPEASSTP